MNCTISSSVNYNEKIACIDKAIDEGMYHHAKRWIQSLDALDVSDGIEKQRLSEKLSNALKAKDSFKILICGDSLSLPRPFYNKQYDVESDPFLSTSLESTYPCLLERLITQDVLPIKQVRSFNLSQRAATIRDLLEKRDDIFCYYVPDVVILQVGIVDCWVRNLEMNEKFASIDEFRDIYEQLISYKLRVCPDVCLILCGIAPTVEEISHVHKLMPPIIKQYNEVIQKTAEKFDQHFLDTTKLFNKDTPYDLIHHDGIHLSTNGHKIFAESLVNIIVNDISLNKNQLFQ
jgi:lysophospholipase L1-like esterase